LTAYLKGGEKAISRNAIAVKNLIIKIKSLCHKIKIPSTTNNSKVPRVIILYNTSWATRHFHCEKVLCMPAKFQEKSSNANTPFGVADPVSPGLT
jgi:hypothetical protein